jgi:prepilin-type processing-associated H-X9-DG protein
MREVRVIASWVTTVLVVICVGVGIEAGIGHSAGANALFADGTGPCAGEQPGCGSPDSSATALVAAKWSTFPAGPLSARSGQVELWTGHELVVWGGGTSQGTTGSVMFDNGAAYDPSTDTWRMLPPAPLAAREGSAAAWTGTEMVVVGGDAGSPDGGAFADAAAYDPATGSWRLLPPFPLGPRTGAWAVWTGRQVVVMGGSVSSASARSGLADDGAAYDPASNTWVTLPPLPPEPGWNVIGVTPAWTGRQLLVWVTWQQTGNIGQGGAYVRKLDTGYGLAAGTRTWTALLGPLAEPLGASTAWTGMVVLVMGGHYCPCIASAGHGAAYNPATEAWQAVPSFVVDEQPWPGIWTGRAFIDLDSGIGLPAQTNDGTALGAYDPESGTWAVLPKPPVELVQSTPTAVWTGKQLLVWGQPSEMLAPAD